jgi:SSS family solute:Na+ symporter
MFLHFIKSPINAGAAAMIAGLIIVPIVSILTPAPDRGFLDDVFASYEQKVLVRKSHSLEDED